MRKPLIGLSTGVMYAGTAHGVDRLFVNADYAQAVASAGGIPLALLLTDDEENIAAQVAAVQGVLLSGGVDVNPLLFGEEPVARMGEISPERDEHELILVRYALKLGKPIFGICRGLQVLNVAAGGTLYQDLSQIEGADLKHNQETQRRVATHTVDVVPGTRLQSLVGDSVAVNSFHHQAVKTPAPGYVINAWSRDGVPEGIEKQGTDFVLGVQWHPEGMINHHPVMRTLFAEFIAAAQKA